VSIQRLGMIILAVVAVFPALAQAAEQPPAPAPKKLLIVAPRSVQSNLAPFVQHKKKLLPTEVVVLEAILKETKGADDAEKLKRYLYNRWKAEKIGYVLLVGDAEVMPVRYIAIHDGGKETGGTTFAVADLYFSDLAKKDGSFDDWNANKEGINAQYYGQLSGFDGKGPINVDQVDYLPDVALGRWPVHTLQQLYFMVDKTIAYENHVLADDLPVIRRTAFVNGPNFVDLRHKMDEWGKKLENVSTWAPVRRYFKDAGRDDKTPPPTQEEIIKVLQNGVGMIFHVGHGSETCWDGCLDIKDLKSLKQAKLPPVMFSIGCSTAMFAPVAPGNPYIDVHGKGHKGVDYKETFDASAPPPNNYQRGGFDRSSLGVEWVRFPKLGCVAYIGCDVGSQDLAWPMMEGFIEYVAATDQPRLGDAWAGAVVKYHNHMGIATIKAHDWVQVAIVHQGMKFQLFGDPSMRLPRAPNPAANLLVNGSFEDGPDVNDFLPLDPGSTAIKGWTVTRGQIDIVQGCWKAAEGKRSVDLHGSPGFGGIEQTFRTSKGQRYRVTFALAGNPDSDRDAKTKRMAVKAAGKTQEFSFDSTGRTNEKMGWLAREWEFNAVDDKTTLEFHTLEKRDPTHGLVLDNVRVVAVPGQ
jgi:choice-of-anchor C domain-containing protein